MSLIKPAPVLCIALAPNQVAFAFKSGRRFVAETAWHQACDNPEGHWKNALALLQSGLQEAPELASATPVCISLASRWCQMLRLPWSDALLTPVSAQRFLQNQYMSLYGEQARDWKIELDDAPYGVARMACALEADLLSACEELAQNFGLHLRSVEPLLSLAWRSTLALPGPRVSAFALIEAERLTLAQTQDGRILQCHSEYWQGNWPQALRHSWQRYCLREPHLSEVQQVALLNLSGQPQKIDAGELGSPFTAVQLHSADLAPSFSALLCQRQES